MVVDPIEATRKRLCGLLGDGAPRQVVGLDLDPENVMERYRELNPVCVALVISGHDPRGFDLLTALREANPYCTLVVLTEQTGEEFRARAFEAGADHFLRQSTEIEHLLELVVRSEAPPARILLLAEEYPGDAAAIQELTELSDHYKVTRATGVEEAVERVTTRRLDVILLALGRPSPTGVEMVGTLRTNAGNIPIVVVTQSDDEEFALACIDAGAQDYLAGSELSLRSLLRSIGYAITRVRETQIRLLQETLQRYRSLSSEAQRTLVTAALAGSGTVSARHPEMFEDMVRHYGELLDLTGPENDPRHPYRERMARTLGDLGAGPRDLLDIHLAALELLTSSCSGARAGYLLLESRLLALEMMGLLVDYYRVGHRRL